MSMTPTLLEGPGDRFSLSGICPHCKCASVFMPVTSIHAVPHFYANNPSVVQSLILVATMQCQGCHNFMLGIIKKDTQQPRPMYWYLNHYPLDKPDDAVPEGIPSHIGADFKEALRCRWVDAYNATGEMCRRALEGSCIEQGAPTDKKLVEMIDWLQKAGKITSALMDVAHKIRLGGNYGAHAPEDPLDAAPMTAEHADALIEFTRDYFQHIYVIPARLSKYDFSKSGMSLGAPSAGTQSNP